MKKTIFILLAVLALTAASFGAQQAVKVDYWIIDGHGGMAYPVGESGNNVNMGFGFGVSARKGLDTEISVGGGISYLNMAYKDTTAPAPFSATVLDAEAVYAPYLPDWFIWPYAKFGIASYMVNYVKLDASSNPVSTSETTFGFLVGGGARYPINNQLAVNLELLFNQASLAGGTGDSYTFLTLMVGVSYYMK
ncbi:MAG: porin family protein [Spirochaetia bacterium]|nr:porin family protein [Spirochaetia bacterium]